MLDFEMNVSILEQFYEKKFSSDEEHTPIAS